jgi:hypothetical protein
MATYLKTALIAAVTVAVIFRVAPVKAAVIGS